MEDVSTADAYRPHWMTGVEPKVSDYDDDTTTFRYPSRPHERLRDLVDQLCRYARFAYDIEDLQALANAQNEANILICSGLFSEDFTPNVHVDQYGEISFTKRFACGYVDIGVCGEGELSFHVRNDCDPSLSHFDDHDYSGASIPTELISAVKSLVRSSCMAMH